MWLWSARCPIFRSICLILTIPLNSRITYTKKRFGPISWALEISLPKGSGFVALIPYANENIAMVSLYDC